MTGREFYESLKHNGNGFPKIMGILNVTPDSFSDGGLHYEKEKAIEHGLKILEDGADIVDVGGESTRPGSLPVNVDEEIRRVVPVIEGIIKYKPNAVISIDTTKSETAAAAVAAGAMIINDISGLNDDLRIAGIAAEKHLPLIIMHIQGSPRTMQANPHYENLLQDITKFLKNRINLAEDFGAEYIIADIGIGFGKTLEHNLKLLKYLPRFTKLGVPLLLGISRKNFIKMVLNVEEPQERDVPTAMIHALLADSGVSIIRVHDVALHSQLRVLYNALN
jgi:dihydropteroate synthase